MGYPQNQAGPLIGAEVISLPNTEADPKAPWPTYSVPPAVRQSVSQGKPPKQKLSPLPQAQVVQPPVAPIGAPAPAGGGAPPLAASPAQPGPPSGNLKIVRQASAQTGSPAQQPQPQVVPQPAPAKPRQATPPVAPAARTPGAAPVAVGRAPKPVPAAATSVDGLATGALVLGIMALVFGLFTAIPAIVLGHIALLRSDPIWTPPAVNRRSKIALALGYTFSVLWLVILVAVSIALFSGR
jgi:hypothetical protein